MIDNLAYEDQAYNDPNHEISQLEKYKNNPSCFCEAPASIGRITFCDSTQDDSPMTKEEKKKFLLPRLLIMGGILVASICLMLLVHFGFVAVTIITGCLIYGSLSVTKFNGKDLFIGEEGFAVIEFKGSRKNIIKTDEYLFDSIDFWTSGEVRIYEDKKYQKTNRTIKAYSVTKTETDYKINKVIEKADSHFSDENERVFGIEYNFWSKVEDIWSNINFIKIRKQALNNAGKITFPILGEKKKDDIIFAPLYQISEDEFQVHADYAYQPAEIIEMGTKKGTFYIKARNPITNAEESNKFDVAFISNKKYFIELTEAFRLKHNIKQIDL